MIGTARRIKKRTQHEMKKTNRFSVKDKLPNLLTRKLSSNYHTAIPMLTYNHQPLLLTMVYYNKTTRPRNPA